MPEDRVNGSDYKSASRAEASNCNRTCQVTAIYTPRRDARRGRPSTQHSGSLFDWCRLPSMGEANKTNTHDKEQTVKSTTLKWLLAFSSVFSVLFGAAVMQRPQQPPGEVWSVMSVSVASAEDCDGGNPPPSWECPEPQPTPTATPTPLPGG